MARPGLPSSAAAARLAISNGRLSCHQPTIGGTWARVSNARYILCKSLERPLSPSTTKSLQLWCHDMSTTERISALIRQAVSLVEGSSLVELVENRVIGNPHHASAEQPGKIFVIELHRTPFSLVSSKQPHEQGHTKTTIDRVSSCV